MALKTLLVEQKIYAIEINKTAPMQFDGIISWNNGQRIFTIKIVTYNHLKKQLVGTLDGQFFASIVVEAVAEQCTLLSEQTLHSFLVKAVQTHDKAIIESKKIFTPRLVSPLAGRVIKILVQDGHVVQARQPLIIIESMKMENEICAPQAAIISSLTVTEGNIVTSNQQLMTFDAI
ncbi:acetyl-CoA carboxylase biotin carboxyl carrier protein subunit [bacterium]|nr:MAG: acetyl-CoA carboxylase biotin carboxyl carrier protein subunit [bacterium]